MLSIKIKHPPLSILFVTIAATMLFWISAATGAEAWVELEELIPVKSLQLRADLGNAAGWASGARVIATLSYVVNYEPSAQPVWVFRNRANIGHLTSHWSSYGGDIADYAFHEIGRFGPPSFGDIKAASAETNWGMYIQDYELGDGNRLSVAMGRLAPGVLFDWTGRDFVLFGGAALPRHVAFKCDDEVVVHDLVAGDENELAIDLTGMSEPWLLFWHGAAARFPHAWRAIMGCPATAPYKEPVDEPTLAILQHKLTAIQSEAAAKKISLSFLRACGRIQIAPLYDMRFFKPEETEAWAQSFPAETARDCSEAAARLGRFPLSVKESFQVRGNGDIAIKNEFTFAGTDNDWDAAPELLCPVSPMLGIAIAEKFPVELSGAFIETPVCTPLGRYCGVRGESECVYVIKDSGKYIDERLVWTGNAGEAGARFLDELRADTAKTLAAGHLAPFRFEYRMGMGVYGPRPYWSNPAESLEVFGACTPALAGNDAKAMNKYTGALAAEYPPWETSLMPYDKGARREWRAPTDFQIEKQVYEIETQTVGQYGCTDYFRQYMHTGAIPPENIYGIWSFAERNNGLEVVAPQFADVAGIAGKYLPDLDWALMCLRYPGFNTGWSRGRGGVPDINAWMSAYIGLARLAAMLGDEDTEQLARYLFAKTAALRFACGKFSAYMYGSGVMREFADAPDWFSRGGGTPTQLLKARWVGAEDDARQIVAYNELGPELAVLDTLGQAGLYAPFLGMCPETFRFMGDHLAAECRRYLDLVEENIPDWHVTDNETVIGWERGFEAPSNPESLFLACAYALGAEPSALGLRLDVPYVRFGDLCHIRKLLAALYSAGAFAWRGK